MSFKLSSFFTAPALALGATCAAFSFLLASAATAQTVTTVMQSGLRVTDPVLTTAYITRDHGYMIYDTLVGLNANFEVKPQMADWKVSADAKVYTFTLRDGLKWHDGASVVADDCVTSIKRWAQKDSIGMVLMPMIAEMKVLDEKSFQIVLKEPTDLLLQGLAKLSSRPAFMMPKRIAETPATQPIKEYIGSGPFKFVSSEFQPGLKVVYEKNKAYVPRKEPVNWTAGGKVVNVDRVQWISMPDQMTAINALMNDEIDYIQQVPFDLLPMLEGNKDIKATVVDKLGNWGYYRFNHLQPPFNNKLIRQAAMYAIGQKEILSAMIGNPDYYKTCAAILGCGTPYANAYGEDIVVPSNIEKARQLLKEAKYDNTPVVIMHPTDIAMLSAPPVVIAAALRKAGFNVQLKAMDWQTLVALRENKKPASDGGWSLYSTYSTLATSGDPFSNGTVSAPGASGWSGWPSVPEIEALRMKFARATVPADRKQITEQIQKLAIDEGVIGPMGQFVVPAAYNNRLSGVLDSPITVFWNMKKAEE
ncbi:ABC transporter substrate-binding protein [Advenella incenata]